MSAWETRLAANDARVAGIITTPRFASRFANSGLNKSRRRAAAVFRFMLCDPMSLLLESGSSARDGEIDAVFGPKEEALRQELQTSSDQRHGADAACMSCHYKLDPMGQVLNSLRTHLSAYPFTGALVYKRASGELLQRPLAGIGALTREIVTQPEYVKCQTRWFWETYIGKDVPLKPAVHQEIIARFESGARRPRDFVEYLVQRPEFRTRPAIDTRTEFEKIQPLLQRCDRCHSTGLDAIPEMSRYPVSLVNDPSEHDQWIARMKTRLFLPANDPRRMPKNPMDWEPGDLELLKNWISKGAPYGS